MRFLFLALFISQCTQPSSCTLPTGSYPVHTVSYDHQSSSYTIHLFDTPHCFQNPLRVTQLQLTQAHHRTELHVDTEQSLSLALRPEDTIQVQPTASQGQESSSFAWAPFLMGAATGAMANSVFRRPPTHPPQIEQRPHRLGQKSLPKSIQELEKKNQKSSVTPKASNYAKSHKRTLRRKAISRRRVRGFRRR